MRPLLRNIKIGLESAAAATALGVASVGCHIHEPVVERVPAMVTRFTINPLTMPSSGTSILHPPRSPGVRVGLAMQCDADPVHIQFAGRLGTVLVRELQLSAGSFEVEPLASLPLVQSTPPAGMEVPADVITVNFQDAQETLPPQLPPSPLFLTPAPPLVDQILVVRIIEYRPYFPMLATLEIRVLDAQTQDPMFTTTVAWSGVDYRLAACRPKPSWRKKLLFRESTSDPSPEHNSPQALMHEIAGDISARYTSAPCPTAIPSESDRQY